MSSAKKHLTHPCMAHITRSIEAVVSPLDRIFPGGTQFNWQHIFKIVNNKTCGNCSSSQSSYNDFKISFNKDIFLDKSTYGLDPINFLKKKKQFGFSWFFPRASARRVLRKADFKLHLHHFIFTVFISIFISMFIMFIMFISIFFNISSCSSSFSLLFFSLSLLLLFLSSFPLDINSILGAGQCHRKFRVANQGCHPSFWVTLRISNFLGEMPWGSACPAEDHGQPSAVPHFTSGVCLFQPFLCLKVCKNPARGWGLMGI